MSTQLVIDGFSLAYRAYYAYPPTLTTDDGQPIHMVYGFLTLLFNAIDELSPTHCVVCFDRPEPTFRHTAYEEYKAHRPPAPDDFKSQIPFLKEALADSGIPTLEQSGFEADDLMGWLSVVGENEQMTTLLYTGDQDCFQLVSDYTRVVMPQRGKKELLMYTPEKVKDKLGVTPDQVIDFKALKGDTSDNIPGVKGVGDKTAVKLLTDYKTLQGIYDEFDSIASAGLRTKLISDKKNAFLSYELARIHRDPQISLNLDDFLIQINWKGAHDVFHRFQFKSLLRRYQQHFESISNSHHQPTMPECRYVTLTTELEIKEWFKDVSKGVSVDVETTSLSIQEASIVGVSFAKEIGEACYIPMNEGISTDDSEVAIPMFSDGVQVTSKKKKNHPLLKVIKPYLEDESLLKYVHHGKFDLQIFRTAGIKLKGIAFDTMIAAFLLFPLERVSLSELVLRHFNFKMDSYEDVVGKGKSQIGFESVPIEQAASYAAADADFTFRLTRLFEPQLLEKGFSALFDDIEMPLSELLADMEYEGVSIDIDQVNQLRHTFSNESERLKAQIYALAGREFNIQSTQQLATILFDELQLPVIKKTKTGRSTDVSVLESLRFSHPIIEPLIDFRTVEKLLNTYVNVFPQLIANSTGRIHTSFNQTVAITGRLSSTSPNLQNIPIRTERGMSIRKVFLPSSKEHILLAADYSQIELRLMAHFSGDQRMIDTFNNGGDIHRSTAAVMFNCDEKDITKDQRYQAKAVNFGIIYGISAHGLSQNLGITRKEAQQMIDQYFSQFPHIQQFIQQTIAEAKSKGYVKTAFGRCRPLPFISSGDRNRRLFEERAAVNTILQGTAADIMKCAMLRIYKDLDDLFQTKMIIQVHDELLFDVPKDELDRVVDIVVQGMMSVVNYDVSLDVNVDIGPNWLDKINYFDSKN